MTDEPLDDYLWDRSGEADAELRELERLLARYRHNRPLPSTADDGDACDESGA